jgi:hypothetical protein
MLGSSSARLEYGLADLKSVRLSLQNSLLLQRTKPTQSVQDQRPGVPQPQLNHKARPQFARPVT